MSRNKLENKIKKATKNKEYDDALEIISNEYIKLFKKMLKYKKVNYSDSDMIYLYNYLYELDNAYPIFSKEIDELKNILYSQKYNTKEQIVFLLENYSKFENYK